MVVSSGDSALNVKMTTQYSDLKPARRGESRPQARLSKQIRAPHHTAPNIPAAGSEGASASIRKLKRVSHHGNTSTPRERVLLISLQSSRNPPHPITLTHLVSAACTPCQQ